MVEHLCNHRKQDLDEVKQLEFLLGKKLADPCLGQPGRVDLLIGIKHLNWARCHMRIEDAPDRDMTAMETQFGWVLGGDSCREEALAAEPQPQPAMHDKTLYEFFERKEIPDQEEPTLAVAEQQAMILFQSTTTRLPDGHYKVRLPKWKGVQLLGESRLMPNVSYFKMSVP